jgi:hypothetical protein
MLGVELVKAAACDMQPPVCPMVCDTVEQCLQHLAVLCLDTQVLLAALQVV